MADPIVEALANLRSARSALITDLERISAAIEALEGVTAGRQTSVPTLGSTNGFLASGGERRPVAERRMTIAGAVNRLLDEGDRDWSAPEIVGEYNNRGTPVIRENSDDPAGPVRTALHNGVKAGRIVRVGEGRYKSARFVRTVNEGPALAGPSFASMTG